MSSVVSVIRIAQIRAIKYIIYSDLEQNRAAHIAIEKIAYFCIFQIIQRAKAHSKAVQATRIAAIDQIQVAVIVQIHKISRLMICMLVFLKFEFNLKTSMKSVQMLDQANQVVAVLTTKRTHKYDIVIYSVQRDHFS